MELNRREFNPAILNYSSLCRDKKTNNGMEAHTKIYHMSTSLFAEIRSCTGKLYLSSSSLPNLGGTIPLKLPTAKSRHLRLVRFPNSAGISPLGSFYPRKILSTEESCPCSGGILPEVLLPEKPRNFSLPILKESGIEPSKNFLCWKRKLRGMCKKYLNYI